MSLRAYQELARAIRERDADVPMAVITGWGESVSTDEQQAAHVNWVITKPFSVGRVAEITAELSQRYVNPAKVMAC